MEPVITIPYDFNGKVHHMSREEFFSCGKGESLESYALGEPPKFENPTAQTIYRMRDRFRDDEIARILGRDASFVECIRSAYGISRIGVVTDYQAAVLSSGLKAAACARILKRSISGVKAMAHRIGIRVSHGVEKYSDEDIAAIRANRDDREVARQIGRTYEAIRSRRSRLVREDLGLPPRK